MRLLILAFWLELFGLLDIVRKGGIYDDDEYLFLHNLQAILTNNHLGYLFAWVVIFEGLYLFVDKTAGRCLIFVRHLQYFRIAL